VTMQATCSGTTKAGAACRAPAMPGRAYCITHDPERAAELAEWRKRGGKAKSNAARAKKQLPTEPMTPVEAHAYLTIAFKKVLVKQLDPGILNALSTAAKTMAELSKASELEDRMEAIERRLGGKAS
jgi:hypothetical protein